MSVYDRQRPAGRLSIDVDLADAGVPGGVGHGLSCRSDQTGHGVRRVCVPDDDNVDGIRQVAEAYVDGKKLEEGMLNRVEAVIRCYDPCLSCSTHALGQMPLDISLYDKNNNLIDRKKT